MVNDKGSRISLSNAAGKERASMTVFDDKPSMALYDAAGKTRAEIGRGTTVTEDGKEIIHPESSLRLYDPEGFVKWSAP